MSAIPAGFLGLISRTPLILLPFHSAKCGHLLYAKAEFLNPGGSIKDRAAVGLVSHAEKMGQLRKGGTVVEGTAGNTGIGLAHVCRAKGYQCVIYMPDNQSQEKIDLLKGLGADVRPVPAVAYDNPQNYNHQAARYAASKQNTVWTNQFDNAAGNRDYHYQTTGPEIWDQTSGQIDAFTCATGTGGTLAGITRYLKEASHKNVKCYLADPPGSVLASYYNSGGVLKERKGSSITEGIGQGRLTGNLKDDIWEIDGAFTVPDEESIRVVYELLHYDGIYVGASSALNVVAAMKVGEILGGSQKKIVTVLCDGAYRYQSRLFSRSWLQSKGLESSVPEHLQKYIVFN